MLAYFLSLIWTDDLLSSSNLPHQNLVSWSRSGLSGLLLAGKDKVDLVEDVRMDQDGSCACNQGSCMFERLEKLLLYFRVFMFDLLNLLFNFLQVHNDLIQLV